MHRHIFRITATVAAAGVLLLAGCDVDQNPISSEPVTNDLTVTLSILPTNSLRTTDTWTYWTVPVDVTFSAAVGGEAGGTGGGHGHAATGDRESFTGWAPLLAAGDTTLVGSTSLAGISVTMTLADGEDLFELEHDGTLHARHADAGQHHIEVQVNDDATGHHAHGGATVSHCDIHVMAVSSVNDTLEFELHPVQGGHGFRYETNAELPFETYDLHLEVDPPGFLRMHGADDKWTEHIEVEFHDFTFDGSFTGGVIGDTTWVGTNSDSLSISLRGGSVKTYGAVGLGALPLSGSETINFSVRLEDPTVEAHAQPLFESVVTATIHNETTGTTATQILSPIYGHHGFHFGGNVDIGSGGAGGGGGGGGHDH